MFEECFKKFVLLEKIIFEIEASYNKILQFYRWDYGNLSKGGASADLKCDGVQQN